MTSSILRPRTSLALRSPSTHLNASTPLLLPEPLGPTLAVTPESKVISVCRANVLKPDSLMERRRTWRAGYQQSLPFAAMRHTRYGTGETGRVQPPVGASASARSPAGSGSGAVAAGSGCGSSALRLRRVRRLG